MPKFKNIVQIDNDSCKILMYGYIGQYEGISATSFAQELDYAARSYKKANIHIHSGGGDVMEGIAILSNIKSSPLDITIYVDGMAASMGFVIAMCGKPVYMNRWARLMAHRVSGGTYGNADEMQSTVDATRQLEDDLVKMLSEKTKLSVADIESKWFDGVDHWISATEALELGIINGIFDGAELEAPENIQPKELYNQFNNVLKKDEPMKMPKFQAKAKAYIQNIKDEPTDEEAVEVLEKLEKENSETKAEIQKLKDENKKLSDDIAAKNKEAAEKEEAENLETVENAIKDNRIQASQKDHFLAILKVDKKNGLAVLNAMPKGKKLVDELGKTGGEERANWTFEDFTKKDHQALAQMKANEPERYKQLFKAQYGREPKL